jgi:hypothetical protein
MHRCQHLVHPSRQFWNWFCGMAFRAAAVLLLMSSICLPFNISFIFVNRKKSLGARSSEQAGCSNTVICLVAKNSLTDSGLSELVWDHFCTHLPHVKIFSLDFPNCFYVNAMVLTVSRWFSRTIWRTFAMLSSALLVAGRPDLSSSVTLSLHSEKRVTHFKLLFSS